MEMITFEESQLLFDDINLLSKFLIERYNFSNREIEFILSSSLETFKDVLLIDIIFNAYVKLGCIENKNEEEIKLYNKLLNILNHHIVTTNFKDKNSRFMKEFEYVLLHYDEPDLGTNIDDSMKRK